MKYTDLYNLIQESNRILITSHYSPDPDAIGSSLYVYNILKNNLRDKEISVCIEGSLPYSFEFLNGFTEIDNNLLIEKITEYKPDLLIMLDGNNYKRFSKDEGDSEKVSEYIKENGVKTITVDHHPESGKDKVDIYINNRRSSTCEEVYYIFTEDFDFKTEKEEQEAVLFGILGDTGRFLYKNDKHRDTFSIVSEMIDAGLSVEYLWGKMSSLTIHHMEILSELIHNLHQKDNYNYSYLTDEFVNDLRERNIDEDIYDLTYHMFVNQYIRDVEPNKWGFVLIPSFDTSKNIYRGSFRAVENSVDTSVLARLMNGAGHKGASGFKLKAEDIEEALDVVHNVIAENIQEAEESSDISLENKNNMR